MRIRCLVSALLLIVLVPAALEAQRRSPRGQHSMSRDYNSFSLEPYAGAFKDAYDASDTNTGFLLGMRLGYDVTPRGRLLLNAGYSETQDVATPVPGPDYFVYDNQWIFTTAGGEYDVIPGRTSAALGLQAGVGWRRVVSDHRVGTPAPGDDLSDDGYASYEVIVPGLTVRHRLTPRAAITLSLEDYIFDVFEGTADHSPALTLGFTFR